MPGVKPVPWVHVGWDATARGFELCPKAYCAVPHRKRCLRQGRNAIGKLSRRSYPGLPALVARRAVERRKRLLALRVQHGEDRVRGAVSCPLGKRSERRDAGNGKIARLGQARAVEIPIRSPVKVPGPTPTAIRSTPLHPPASSRADSTASKSRRACRGRPVSSGSTSRSASASPEAVTATVRCAVEVSRPRTRCTG